MTTTFVYISLATFLLFMSTYATSSVTADAHADNTSSQSTVVTTSDTGRLTISWVNPENYRDVRESNHVGSRAKYRAYVFENLQTHLSKLIEELPDGYRMDMTVVDVDLAGDTRAGAMTFYDPAFQHVRVMRDVFFPMMDFTYVLRDQSGQVIKQNEIKVKDVNFLRRGGLRTRSQPLEHEKHMLTEWFSKEFKQIVTMS